MPSSASKPSQPEDKCSPRLRAALDLSPEALRDALQRGMASRARSRFLDAQGIFATATQTREPRVSAGVQRPPAPLFGLRIEHEQVIASVLFQFTGDWSSLERQGIECIPITSNIASADIPLDTLRAFLSDPGLIRIELNEPVTRLSSDSICAVGADEFPPSDWTPARNDVIIGIIELEALDFHHPDFCEIGINKKRSRVAYLWDQGGKPKTGSAGKLPLPFGYGVEYTSSELDVDLALGEPFGWVKSRPPIDGTGNGLGHGTHVAGIAAGNGNAQAGVYRGIAPKATVIYVSLGEATGDNNRLTGSIRLLHAAKYIFERAGNTPCVINISLGISAGPRNGTSLLEIGLDDLIGDTTGRVIVAAAGNEGLKERAQRYATGTLQAGECVSIELETHVDSMQDHEIELWYEGNAQLGLTLIDPQGTRFDGTCDTAPSCPYLVSITRSKEECGTLGANILLLLRDRDAELCAGVWTIELSYTPSLTPLKLSYLATVTGGSDLHFVKPAERSTLMSPATATRVIAVANANHKLSFRAALSSARGPRWDGYQKPELAAPGVDIWAPSSHPDPTKREYPYSLKTGTSMAAPHVAGAIALLLQQNPRLKTETVLKLLKQHALNAAGSNGWNPGTGYGCLQLKQIRLEEIMQASLEKKNATESVHHPDAAVKGGDLARVQIDFGNYVIRQNGLLVGRLLVVAAQVSAPAMGNGSAVASASNTLPPNTIEHWCLYENYRPPRATGNPTALEFTHENCSEDPEGKGTLEGFLQHIRANPGALYIQSICAVSDPALSS